MELLLLILVSLNVLLTGGVLIIFLLLFDVVKILEKNQKKIIDKTDPPTKQEDKEEYDPFKGF